MFGKLFLLREPAAIIKVVVEGLYPIPYLDAEDSAHPGQANRVRIEKVSPAEIVP